MKKIAIGGDHAGFEYKNKLITFLEKQGYQVQDFGPETDASCDYADFAHPLSTSVEKGENDMGILLCGSANGVNMVANKHQGIRSGLAWNSDVAKLIRLHNDANVIAIPARFISYHLAEELVDIFLTTEFEGGRHQRRVDKIPC